MAQLQEIPLSPSIGHYQFSTQIMGEDYTFEVRWNARDAAWYFDLFDAAGRVIRRGFKIALGAYIGRLVRHPLFLRDGMFFAYDASQQHREATFDDIGSRVILYFMPHAVQAHMRAYAFQVLGLPA